HLDHLGVRDGMPGDNIFNGADDDASGVTAVLELAEALSKGSPPKRTIVFALFGSEEIGGFGARYFQEHPPVPVESFVANLEFEMIARPDAAVAAHTLWLTGYERSDLGAQLAAHGSSPILIPSKTSFAAQTITCWRRRESSRKQFQVTDCTRTIIGRATIYLALILRT